MMSFCHHWPECHEIKSSTRIHLYFKPYFGLLKCAWIYLIELSMYSLHLTIYISRYNGKRIKVIIHICTINYQLFLIRKRLEPRKTRQHTRVPTHYLRTDAFALPLDGSRHKSQLFSMVQYDRKRYTCVWYRIIRVSSVQSISVWK